MSCGDLDGDVYFVTWNEAITSHVNETFEPANLQFENIGYDDIQTESLDQ